MGSRGDADRRASDSPPFDLCERAFQFSLRVVRLCLALQQIQGVGWLLSKQLFRAGTSIGVNVEEGQAAQSRNDFISKYSIARKEARETRYWLRLLIASKLRDLPEAHLLMNETEQLIKILTASLRKAQSNRNRSP
jgi:four helix bundle protein